MSALVFKRLHGAHQPDIAFLHQVGEGHQCTNEVTGNGDNQSEIAFDKVVHGFDGTLVDFLHLRGQGVTLRFVKPSRLPFAPNEEFNACGVEAGLEREFAEFFHNRIEDLGQPLACHLDCMFCRVAAFRWLKPRELAKACELSNACRIQNA